MDSLNSKGCILFNYRNAWCDQCPNMEKFKNHPVFKKIGSEAIHVWSFFPNNFKLYNVKGNVAEMTSVKGIAKGGSYFHPTSCIRKLKRGL